MTRPEGWPRPGDQLPRLRARWLAPAARSLLRLAGWRIVGRLPNVPRMVIIVAPHRSNWDWVIGMLVIPALGIRVHWLAKHNLFKPGARRILKALGGIPVNRSAATTLVRQAAGRLRQADRFILAMAPEGTRKPVEKFKTGFYRIAHAAEVPILPIWFDYASRTIGLMDLFEPTGDLLSDVSALEQMYRNL